MYLLTESQKAAIEACLDEGQTIEFAADQAGGFWVYADFNVRLEQFARLDQPFHISSVTKVGDQLRVLFWAD